MKYCKVTFENGVTFGTSINGTDEEIKDYYIGRVFNIGQGENDDMQKCISCEIEEADNDI